MAKQPQQQPTVPARRSQLRTARRSKALTRKRRRRIFLGIAVAVGSLALIVGLVLPSLPIGNRAQQGSQSAGPGQRIPVMGNQHIQSGQQHDPYNSIPPTSGPHYANPAPWGIYQVPVEDEIAVHNLEHGAVVFSYNLSDQATITRLVEFVQGQRGYPCYLLVHPYPKVPEGKIVLTAWGVLQEFNSVDETGIKAFIDAYRNRGPELVPCTPQGG